MNRGDAIAGLDFGMTNSLLCYHEPGKLEPVSFRAKGSNAYAVPTIIASGDTRSRIKGLIGAFARNVLGFMENFKVELPRAGLSREERQRNEHFRATQRFLDTLFEDFYKTTGVSGFAKLIVTVPETWFSGEQQNGQDALAQLLEDLGVSSFEFISEPLAAACYFAHRHQQLAGRDFDGHVLVYDHGGSTLDINVARVTGSSVLSISGLGLSGFGTSAGFGGVEFDRRVMARIAERSGTLQALPKADRTSWLHEFERKKCEAASQIESMNRAEQRSELLDERIFTVGQTQVLFADLVEVFRESFAPRIRTDVVKVLQHAMSKEEIDIRNPERFRIVMVGGFSEFDLVQSLMEEIVRAEIGSEEVMRSYLSRDEKWLAVAKGACLAAAGSIGVIRSCPLTFGLVSYVRGEPRYDALMRRDEPIEEYGRPRYLPGEYGVKLTSDGQFAPHDASSITFFVDRAGERRERRMLGDFSQCLPDYGKADWWKVGVAIEGGAAVLKLKSSTEKERTIRMGQLFAMVDNRFDDGFLE